MTLNNLSFDFNDSCVLVAGGSRGIGKGVVDAFQNAGATVLSASRNPTGKSEKNGVLHLTVDLTNENQIKSMFIKLKKFPPIDVLVTAAAINYTKRIDDISMDEWNLVLQTNLTAAFYLCKMVVPQMKKRRMGKIVNISSIAGRHRSPVSGVHYVSSKSGLIGLTKQLAFEVAKYNINVNAVCPSQTMTSMLEQSMSKDEIKELESDIPLNRIATIEDQVWPIMFLCSDAATYITGACIDVNGGQI